MRLLKCPKQACRNTRLALQPLEDRMTPAGSITAVLSPTTGALVITGDDDANVVQLLVGANLTLTPDGGTSINGKAAGVQEVLPGVVKSIKADMRGGDDAISLDGAAAFQVTGAVKIALGDGNNTLDMSTTGILTTGALTVTGGDGSDSVNVAGAINSAINGTARFTFANGGSTTTLDSVALASLNITAGDAVSIPNDVTLTGVTIARTVNVNLANSNPALVAITDSTIGGLTELGYVISALLQNTQVNGNVTLRGGFQADLEVQDGCTLNKAVNVTAPNASISATGDGSLFAKNLTVTGAAFTQVSFQTGTETEIQGGITVKGGWYNDLFNTNNNFKVDRNVTLRLGDGDNTVEIGDGGGLVSIFGTLSIDMGAGADSVTLDELNLTGAAKIKTGAGTDTLTIDDGARLLSSFNADLGSGDDTIAIAQNTGAPNPVTFTGTAKIMAGNGNDTLLLGLSAALGGDANSNAVFNGPNSDVDGGNGIDDFDDVFSQTNGSTTNWNP